ncbi:MAG: (2Fe-2S)-binding protein [Nitrospirales bacterium]
MYLCLCRGINEARVRELGSAGVVTPCRLAAELRIKERDCCGRCLRDIDQFVAVAVSAYQQQTLPPSKGGDPMPLSSSCMASQPEAST